MSKSGHSNGPFMTFSTFYVSFFFFFFHLGQALSDEDEAAWMVVLGCVAELALPVGELRELREVTGKGNAGGEISIVK